MIIGVVLFGSLLFIGSARWMGIYNSLPYRFTLNHAFNQSLEGMERISARITGTYMTGFTRDYFVFIFGFLFVITGWALLSQQAFGIDLTTNSPIYLFEFVVGISLAVSAIVIIFSNSRLTSIIALSVVGFLMSLLYINFRA